MAPIIFKSGLNPHAREFVPTGCAVSTQHASAILQQAAGHDEAQFPLKDLPVEMLSCVISKLPGSSQDLASCLLASEQLQAAVKAARVTFQLTDQQKHVLSNPARAHMLDALVKALIKYMPGTVSCSLSMLPLEHHHISVLAQHLPQLAALDLSGCKKLQPGVTKLLQQPGMLPRLQCLNLQRCFQLTDACLSDLLAQSCNCTAHSSDGNCNCSAHSSDGKHVGAGSISAAGSSSSELQCIALSHLNLSEWPCRALKGSDSNAVGSSESFWQQLQEEVQSVLLHRPASLPQLRDESPLFKACGCRGSSLRVVALNNCNQLSVAALIVLAAACPILEYLMLGGSTLKAKWSSSNMALPPGAGTEAAAVEVTPNAYMPPQIAAAAATAGDSLSATSSSSGQGWLPPALQQFAASLNLPAALPWEILAACCEQKGGMSCQLKSCHCCCNEDSSCSSKAKARKQLERSEPPAAALAAARSHALGLAYVAALLPHLKAMEVTFMAPGVAGWLRACIQQMQTDALHSGSTTNSTGGDCDENGLKLQGRDGNCSTHSIGNFGSSCCSHAVQQKHTSSVQLSGISSRSSSACNGSSSVRVWEFSCVASVQQALQFLQEQQRSRHHAGLSAGLTVPSIETALRCAANCSWSRGRSTALHLAAERGCSQHVSALLHAGAVVSARDSSGASPLFAAAEAGRPAAVSALLEAGADALMSNTAGETPLYIASLRGHLPVVEVLLSHLSAAGVDWMQEGLYGDAWTPLMAAAVANRVDVALCLLRAATGFSKGGAQLPSRTATVAGKSKQGVQYQNPAYAYRNNGRRSVDGGGGSRVGGAGVERLLAAENRYGQTALHIAARKGCKELLRLLLLYGAVRIAGQVVDAAGDTWTDVAKRHGHDVALHELLQQC